MNVSGRNMIIITSSLYKTLGIIFAIFSVMIGLSDEPLLGLERIFGIFSRLISEIPMIFYLVPAAVINLFIGFYTDRKGYADIPAKAKEMIVIGFVLCALGLFGLVTAPSVWNMAGFIIPMFFISGGIINKQLAAREHLSFHTPAKTILQIASCMYIGLGVKNVVEIIKILSLKDGILNIIMTRSDLQLEGLDVMGLDLTQIVYFLIALVAAMFVGYAALNLTIGIFGIINSGKSEMADYFIRAGLALGAFAVLSLSLLIILGKELDGLDMALGIIQIVLPVLLITGGKVNKSIDQKAPA